MASSFSPIAFLAALFLGWAGAAHAQEGRAAAPPAGQPAEPDLLPGDLSGSVALTSDYVFRGISQSDENPAIQGSLDYSHETGLFAGVWGSSVDFDDGDQASVELDWYAGWTGDIQMVTVDARAIYYHYPGANTARDYDYWELAASASTSPLEGLDLTLGYNFSPDFFAESGIAHYVHGEAGYTLPGLPLPVSVMAGLGYQWIDNNGAFGVPDYLHWSLGLGTSVEGVDLTVAYSDTNVSQRECAGGLDTCDQRVVVTASYGL